MRRIVIALQADREDLGHPVEPARLPVRQRRLLPLRLLVPVPGLPPNPLEIGLGRALRGAAG